MIFYGGVWIWILKYLILRVKYMKSSRELVGFMLKASSFESGIVSLALGIVNSVWGSASDAAAFNEVEF